MKPKISVVIPAFNAERFIAETLFSVDRQTLKPFEVIVVDDGSKDKTADVVDWFFNPGGLKRKYARVLLHNDENMGIGYSRQRGAEWANGDYVAYVMSDDVWSPQFLEKSAQFLDEDHATFTNYWRCDEHMGSRKGFATMPHDALCIGMFRELAIKWALRKNVFVNSSCVVIPKKWFETVKFQECLRTQEDIVFLLDTLIQGFKWRYVPERLLYYRVHPGQVTHFQNEKDFTRLWSHLMRCLNLLDISIDVCMSAYQASKKRTFPSLLSRVVNKGLRTFKLGGLR